MVLPPGERDRFIEFGLTDGVRPVIAPVNFPKEEVTGVLERQFLEMLTSDIDRATKNDQSQSAAFVLGPEDPYDEGLPRYMAVINPDTYPINRQMAMIRLYDRKVVETENPPSSLDYIAQTTETIDKVIQTIFPQEIEQLKSLISTPNIHSLVNVETVRRMSRDKLIKYLNNGHNRFSLFELSNVLVQYFNSMYAHWGIISTLSVDTEEFTPTPIDKIVERFKTGNELLSVNIEARGPAARASVSKTVARDVLGELMMNPTKYRKRDESLCFIEVHTNFLNDVREGDGHAGERYVEITVADNALEISLQELPRIFEPGYRTNGARELEEGTGQGLNKLRGVVLDRGGSIKVVARDPNTGSVNALVIQRDENGHVQQLLVPNSEDPLGPSSTKVFQIVMPESRLLV